jgi:hypothetical protein
MSQWCHELEETYWEGRPGNVNLLVVLGPWGLVVGHWLGEAVDRFGLVPGRFGLVLGP